MVPEAFQAPISAPTANRMKIALVIDERAPSPTSSTAVHLCPFFIATRAATAQQMIKPT
jgi:hypothetical protein